MNLSSLPDSICFHIFIKLNPTPTVFFSLSLTSSHLLRQVERYLSEYFKADGCCGYLYPHVQKVLCTEGVKIRNYYSIVHDLIKPFRIVTLCDAMEVYDTKKDGTAIHVCSQSNTVLIRIGFEIIEFLAYAPYKKVNGWMMTDDVSRDPLANVALASVLHGKVRFLGVQEGDSFTKYWLMDDGSMQELQTVTGYDSYYLENDFVVGARKGPHSSYVSFYVSSPTNTWKDKFGHLHVLQITSDAILAEDVQNLYVINMLTGAKTVIHSRGHKSKSRFGAIKAFNTKGKTRWQIVIYEKGTLVLLTGDGSSFTLEHTYEVLIPTNVQNASGIFIHSRRIVLVLDDGSMYIIRVQNTTVRKSRTEKAVPKIAARLPSMCEPARCASVAVTEDSHVFMCLEYGLCFTLDFSDSTPMPPCLEEDKSSYFNKLITKGLKDVGVLYKSLVQAATKSDVQKILEKYDAFQQKYGYQSNIRMYHALTSVLQPFKQIAFVFESLKSIRRLSGSSSSMLSMAQTALDQSIMEPTVFPDFPLVKELTSLREEESKITQHRNIINWLTMAKKFPERITLTQVRSYRARLKVELGGASELLKTCETELDNIETTMVSKIANSISEKIGASVINIATAPSKLQVKVFENFHGLLSTADFEKIKPLINTNIEEFLAQVQDFGDMNSTSKAALKKCLDLLADETSVKNQHEIKDLLRLFLASCSACEQKQNFDEEEEPNEEEFDIMRIV